MDDGELIQMHDGKMDGPEVRLLFAGDLVLSDKWKTPPFDDPLRDTIQTSDAACVNLEAPFESGSGINKNGPTLSTIPETPEVLCHAGFDIACLANNHMMDYGYESVKKTIDACTEAGIATVGTGVTRAEAIEPHIYTQNGHRVALYNVCQHEFGVASATAPGTAWIDSPGLIRDIMTARSDFDFVFVVVHGGNENVPLPSIRWQERLRELVDAGADAVVAHHPHVPQGWEIYEDSPIFYSLGNFVFDQTKYDANQWGYCVELCLQENEITRANVLLTERIGRSIQTMGEDRDREVHYEYLQNVSDIIESSPVNPGYWQAVAHQLYSSKYEGFFRQFGGGDPISLYNSPLNEMKRMFHLAMNWAEVPAEKKLKLLNFVRAEAHREAIIAGLEVETRTVEDHRTPDIQSTVDELYDCLYNGLW